MCVFVTQDTGLYYHRYLQEVINVLETDGHFREKLQAANAEDIKVWLAWRRGVCGAESGTKEPRGCSCARALEYWDKTWV